MESSGCLLTMDVDIISACTCQQLYLQEQLCHSCLGFDVWDRQMEVAVNCNVVAYSFIRMMPAISIFPYSCDIQGARL